MHKWSVLIEVDAENMEQFNKDHVGLNLCVKLEDVIGIMKIEDGEK